MYTPLTESEIQTVIEAYPGTRCSDMNAHYQWARWRAILDRITRNKHYRYDDPQKWTLLRMAEFAVSMMAHYNGQAYRAR